MPDNKSTPEERTLALLVPSILIVVGGGGGFLRSLGKVPFNVLWLCFAAGAAILSYVAGVGPARASNKVIFDRWWKHAALAIWALMAHAGGLIIYGESKEPLGGKGMEILFQYMGLSFLIFGLGELLMVRIRRQEEGKVA
jgi:hypothetical protein